MNDNSNHEDDGKLERENKWLKEQLYRVYADNCEKLDIQPDDIHQWWRNIEASVA